MSLPSPNSLFAFDEKQKVRPYHVIAGVDEAGRGPLAGPVVAAAVILTVQTDLELLNDSKKLTEKKREILFHAIISSAIVGIGVVHPEEIDQVNIYQATRVAMRAAILDLTRTPDHLLIDGTMSVGLKLSQKAIVKGDAKSASIAAASIVAKVYRDAWMRFYDELYPCYGFARHKGYGTRVHRESLKREGPSPIHRRTFNPLREMLERKT